MTGLAFNLNGDPFELPALAVGFRVKKLKSKGRGQLGQGAPELVFGSDGLPLTVPIDADIDDLRRDVAGVDGKYRLDPVDEAGHVIPNCPAAYVVVHPTERSMEAAPVALGHGPTDAGVEAMRMNSELARAIIDRFPSMIDSVAGLIRAADGAGLPAREPRGLVLAPPLDDEPSEDDEDDDEAADDDERSWPAMIERVLPQLMPFLQALTQSKRKTSAGAATRIDGHAHVAARVPTTSAAGNVPAPGPRDPAPARPRAHATPTQPAPTNVAPSSAQVPVVPASAAAALPDDLPTLDAPAMARLLAVSQGLTLEEQMLASELIHNRFTGAELRAFVDELQAMSIQEAIAEVRAVLGLEATNAPNDGAAS